MLKIIFPRTPEQEFLKCVQEQQGNWLTAARVFHFNHPESLESFAMRYGVGATPYHPFCDLIAEVRPEEAPEEASSGGSGQRERVGIGYGSGGQGITAQQYQQYQMQAQQQARYGFGW
ncbi:MAG: hypothetical protein EZS28_021011 [Streblomastix strix]|uniref:Uncharacterized protein n=1 Tax=Streblomastix strix TaxID=222440 RepID=A0A5J4VLK9_9EUKA|nr:MAG: hypothetical protein EZS28_021011 [Streblomastix strix]